MQRVVVKSVITKPTKKEGTNITTIEDEKGAKMSAFNDDALAKVHTGDILEVEISIDGKYTNIKSWKLLESKPQPAQAPAPQPRQEAFKADPDKIASMEKQKTMEIDSKFRDTALMQACEYYKETEHRGIPDVLSCADKFYAWLKGEKSPEKPVGKESVQPAQQEATLPIVDGLTGVPTEITTGAKLASFASKHGVPLSKFNSLLQSNPNDIKDIPAAWAILFPNGIPTK